MIQENELVMLFLCAGICLFSVMNMKRLKRFSKWSILFIGFLFFFMACILTVFEGFILKEILNYLEHLCYLASVVFLVMWCLKPKKRCEGEK